MRVLVSQPLSVVASTVPETDAGEWASGTAYTAGQEAQVTAGSTATHMVYAALTGNTGKYPPDNATDWAPLRPTHRWALVDPYYETRTAVAGGFSCTLSYDGVPNALALLNVVGVSVDYVQRNPGGDVVHSGTVGVVNPHALDWEDYFFGPDLPNREIVVPLALWSGTLELTFNSIEDGLAGCGQVIVGMSRYLGKTLYGPRIGLRPYSRKTTDEYGRTSISKGRVLRTVEYDVQVETSRVTPLVQLVKTLDAERLLLLGNNEELGGESFDCLNIYGFIKDVRTVLSGPTVSDLAIEVEELA